MTSFFEDRTLELPDDINLPFFAYGIFKPGQIAHPKIKRFVDEYTDNVKISYLMKHRDGVPILIEGENERFQTEGTIIKFKEGKQRKAYGTISKTELRKLYEWKTISINGETVNVLFGVNPENGSDYIENKKESICFDGKNDPLFKEAIELIEENLKSSEHSWKAENFFKLQMNYILLWSAIERYSSIKYNKPLKKWNNEQFAKEKEFEKGIKKFKGKRHMPVYSTEDLKMYEFDADDAFKTLNYYYTFRCNIVHRGKSMYNDYKMLKTAADELLEIFKNILEDTFDGE